ncbi:LOW QUALITY PROTEIN: stalled ribosome sensor GCN1-like [Saccoglossus kowalevskii]|uniref:LOW QUALITY PROTEIN: translational activator GCN1-like n=1 Tax=Saccoglossus kowalevskii TaxID=10224 RepID=A0ABM0MDP9_SACKO|nr:PREDICTED: LOW QUALITY PROTEIN: translational activator GCN1-like [Saccoglossus kowalevskii]
MAADSKVLEVLKEFSVKATSSSTKERGRVLTGLLTCVAKTDLPEKSVKGVCRILALTLPIYHDGTSRRLVEQVIKELLNRYGKLTIKAVISILEDTAAVQRNIHHTPATASSALVALNWTCILATYCLSAGNAGNDDDDVWRKLVEVQVNLTYAALGSNRKSINQSAYRKLKKVWKENPTSMDKYGSTLGDIEQSFHLMPIIGQFIKYCGEGKVPETIEKYRKSFLDIYIKSVIMSKTKPTLHALESSKFLLKYVSHDEFKTKIVPAVQKSMLRSPENVLRAVSEMLGGLSIDLSQYSKDLGKLLAAHLHSKNELARDEAVDASKNLAKQCSDPGALEELVQHYFAVLNGSEGKLTVTMQRMGVLSGIGSLTYNTVSGPSVQNLAATAADNFIPYLQLEVHEGTLVHALSVLALWCSKFSTQVPIKLVEWFKKGITLKTSTSPVRNGYLLCMLAAFQGDTLLQGMDVMPLLLQTVEKANSQSSQINIVTEGLTAASLLVKLSLVDIQAESKLGQFWNTILNAKKQLFVSDKFLTSVSADVLQNLLIIIERLLLDNHQRLNDEITSHYLHALVATLVHPAWTLRQSAQQCCKKVLRTPGGTEVAYSLLKEYRKLLSSQKVQDYENLLTSEESSAEPSKVIRPQILVSGLSMVVLGPDFTDSKECHALAMEILFDTHHPCIVYANPNLWTDLLVKLKVEPLQFVAEKAEEIFTKITSGNEITEPQLNALKTLVRIAPSEMLPRVITHCVSFLGTAELYNITQDEFAILLTPEGELYNKSVLASAAQSESMNFGSMRRENKAYSYKEQLMEMELRKELEKKKAAKTGKKEPQLSKKQQEIMQAELEKESTIRKKMKKLDVQLSNITHMLMCSSDGNMKSMRQHVPTLLRSLLSLVSSLLAAPHVTKVFLHLRKCAFDSNMTDLGNVVAYSTLRLHRPQCDIDSEWCQEDLITQATRVVNMLYNTTVPTKNTQSYGVTKKAESLPPASFSYCFPFLRCVLKDGGKEVHGDDVVMEMAVEIITVHAQLRSQSSVEQEQVDEEGPDLLPRRDMLRLLTQLIATSTPKLQQMSSKALLDVCMCASGLNGCTIAEQEEIDVLLDVLQSPCNLVREAALQGLLALTLILPTTDVNYEEAIKLTQRVWVAKHDTEEDNVKLADRLWDECDMELDSVLCTKLIKDIVHHESVIRESSSSALANAVEKYPDCASDVLKQLFDVYQKKQVVPPPVIDSLGRVVSESPPDQFHARCGIALSIKKMSPHLSQDEITPLFDFFVPGALGDKNEEVRKKMLDASLAAINVHGKDNVGSLLPVFETFMDEAPNSHIYDAVRQSVVILMGSLARHLDKDNPKVKPIVAKLIAALSTPSQQVQEAVANCLPPLVPAIKEDAPGLVQKLLQLLLESENYGERKGAAYGLAGLVKGLGILSLKQLEIMPKLSVAIQDKKNFRHREGALFAFEMLCIMLGRLFEPYVVHVLPNLLLCFGDNNAYVREATDETSKAVMSKLSAHGVKLVLPSLLAALEEESWRTKAGSVELLGAMAFCAPKQLSSCLPTIVPKLTTVLTDSHVKVQKAGQQALKQIGSVIKNPEIQAIVPVLLDAISDPARKTAKCLQILLDTKFVHFIDAPSLALIMPVVQRAFQDRSTETKKMAAQIIGNMYSLTDPKDLAPYLPSVVPGLKASLLDPVPEVRSVSARALGAIIKGMGDSGYDELLPWLMEKLRSESSSVDRSGAAQGLSEVVSGLGIEKLQKLMPEIIETASRDDIASHIRDGYIMMFIYLPLAFGDRFLPYVSSIIPPILKSLADENEYLRDTALLAGQRMISMYAQTAITLFLPQLEKGLFDENWRIRYSSVQLLGDLLFHLTGVTGKMTTEGAEDDNFGTERSTQAIMEILGSDRRNRVLAGLYMGRSDTALLVRQAALHVWKVVVVNTPKTLRSILPTLFNLLLGCLASTSYDKRQVAARTLGDLVRKLGDRVLPDLIPILEKGLDSPQPDQRQGVCVGLSEIMSSTSKEQVVLYVDSLVPTVRKALIDPLPDVRQAAAKTFDNLHNTIGYQALDDILPPLLDSLDDPTVGPYALDGLREVMAVKSIVVLPYLVPKLTASPVNIRALAVLSEVAGAALTKHLSRILPALLGALNESAGSDKESENLIHCQTLVLSVTDELGVRTIVDELLVATKHDSVGTRKAAVTILNAYCTQSKADLTLFVPSLFTGLIRLFNDEDQQVLEFSWSALNAVVKRLNAAEQLQHISSVRQAVKFAADDVKEDTLPGFCLPKKGITPVLPLFREGILNGSPELREQAAIGLGEVIKLTSAEALKPSVVHITGPLIRILGDRFSWNVKVAVLDTLGLLLAKVGVMLKPFLPQLQTTFLKALNDPNRAVRLKSAAALEKLIVIHTRVDPLFTELHSGVKNADDSSVRETTLHALRGVIRGAGHKMGDAIRKTVTTTLIGMLGQNEDVSRMCAAGCVGSLCACLPEAELLSLLDDHLLISDPSADWTVKHGTSVAIGVALKEAPEQVLAKREEKLLDIAMANATTDRIPICVSGIRCIGFLARHYLNCDSLVPQNIISTLVKSLNSASNDLKITTAQMIYYISNQNKQPLNIAIIKPLVTVLVSNTKERNTMVQATSEQAIVSLLQLRRNDDLLQEVMKALDSVPADNLQDCMKKLRKVANQPHLSDEEIDDTLLH